MPGANRYIVPGQIYHLTHRCHNQAFLLRFGIDREGSMAQEYNLRKKRSGAFWGERYHGTMIDSSEYLWRCLQ
jgi:putative transposase